MEPTEMTPSVLGTLLNVRSKFFLLLSWISMASIILAAEYVAGPAVRLPLSYILPVGLAAWYNGRWWGIALAVALPLARLYFTTIWTMPWTFTDSAMNAAIRIATLVGFAILIDHISQQTKALNREVKALEGVLPACRSCERILDEKKGTWHVMKNYIVQRSEARCRDIVCPECAAGKHLK